MSFEPSHLRQDLLREIMMARRRVYRVGSATPTEELDIPEIGRLWLKREDLSQVHAYKWRGAFNKMAILAENGCTQGVTAASAGNHAQGVALAASRLDMQATIFMPSNTPGTKRAAVAKHGGDHVTIRIVGDTYDEAAAASKKYAKEHDLITIPAYDDLEVMGGQGTVADEIVLSGSGPFTTVYVPIGGGGLAAGVACWLKAYYPDIQVIGVEGEGQASMKRAMDAGGVPSPLDYVDVFCDGTAVRQTGDLTTPLCAELLDGIITLSNDLVCAAIQLLWSHARILPEPSGALGVAAMLKQKPPSGARPIAIISGGNVDFEQLAWIARRAGIGLKRRRFFRFHIREETGSLIQLLEQALDGINIFDFQYGKLHRDYAWPVLGCEGTDAQFAALDRQLALLGIEAKEVTGEADVDFRIIHYESDLWAKPFFCILEFPERPGALFDFMRVVGQRTSICYFNYASTGEQVGRALMGFEFETESDEHWFKALLEESGLAHHPLPLETVRRIL